MPEPFLFQTRIRFIDTDASARIHYTCMFRYFESAEIEFMREFNLTYGKHEFHFPRVHVECDFLAAIYHDDLIEIAVCLTKLGKSSIRFDFRTFKEGSLAAKGAVVIACMNTKTERSAPIPDDLRALLEPKLMEGPLPGD